MKKVLSIILSVLMLVSIIPMGMISASAETLEMNYSFTASRSNLAKSLKLVPVSKDVFNVTVVLDSAPLEFSELENTEGVNWGFYTSDGKYVANDYHTIRSGNEMVPTLTLEMENVSLKAGESYRLYCMATEYDYQLDYDASVTGADDYVTFFVGVPITKDYFPDDNFRARIGGVDDGNNEYLTQGECDVNQDGILSKDEIESVNEIKDIYGETISYEGWGYFTNVKSVNFYCPLIRNVDLSVFPKLEELSANSYPLSSIDFSHNSKLKLIALYDSKLTSIDISGLDDLYYLSLENAPIKSLDIPENSKISKLFLEGTEVSSLNWSNLKNLKAFYSSKITDIDLTSTYCLTVDYIDENGPFDNDAYFAFDDESLTYNVKMTCKQKANYDKFLSFDATKISSYFDSRQLKNLQNAKTNIEVVHIAPTDGVDYKAPTCTDNGYKKYTCVGCGEQTIELLLATGHQNFMSYDNAVAPTCTTAGREADRICTDCMTEIKGKTTPATGHTLKTTVTKATTSKNGSKVTKCTVCGTQTAKSTVYYPKTITLSATKYTYDGKVKKPTVKVVDANGKTISSTNYTVTYSNNTKVGKATVKVTFKGDYSGTVSKTFTIVPKSTTVSSLSAVSKGFTAKWKKQATQTTGYQIQIATDSKFTKGVKSYSVAKNSTVSKKITKLTGKKKYYVRIRTYKTVSGTKYYSAWSKAMTIKTK